jgi:hypothetical protein
MRCHRSEPGVVMVETPPAVPRHDDDLGPSDHRSGRRSRALVGLVERLGKAAI